MDWAETSPGRWQRALGENESMIKVIGDSGAEAGKDVWSIAATAVFSAHRHPPSEKGNGKPLAEALQDGWRTLRFQHPSIATTSDGDAVCYSVPSSADELEEWVDETFITVDGEEASLARVIRNLAPRRRTTCYHLEKHNAVVLHLSHWRTDGVGALHLLGALLAAAAENMTRRGPPVLCWGQEVGRLVPCVEEALGLPETPTEEIQRAADSYLETVGHHRGALEAPVRRPRPREPHPQPGPAPAPGGTRALDDCLSAAQTARALAACGRLGVRIEAALHASVTSAAYALAAPSSRHRHHSTTLRHSLRPHLTAPWNGAAGAAGLFTAGYAVRVPASQSWLENARQYEAEYERGATAQLLCSRRQYAAAMRKMLLAASSGGRGRDAAPQSPPPPGGVDVSWVPDAQSLVRGTYSNGVDVVLTVENIGIGVEVLSRHAYVFGWIFEGRLSLRIVCNGAFWDAELCEKLSRLVKETLAVNLLL